MTFRTGNFIRRPLALAGAGTVALLSITGVTLVGPGVLAGESRSAPLPVTMPSASSAVPAPPPANIEPAPDPEPSITVAVAKPRPAASNAAGRRPTRAVKKPPAAPEPVSATTVPAPPQPDCRQSTDPACGPVRWSPELGPTTPASVGWRLEPAQPVAGQPFDLVIGWIDLEAANVLSTSYCMPDLVPASSDSKSPNVVGICGDGVSRAPCDAHGTWPLPQAYLGHGEYRFSRTLPAGTYNFDFGISLGGTASSATPCQPDPYLDGAFVKDAFTVLPSS